THAKHSPCRPPSGPANTQNWWQTNERGKPDGGSEAGAWSASALGGHPWNTTTCHSAKFVTLSTGRARVKPHPVHLSPQSVRRYALVRHGGFRHITTPTTSHGDAHSGLQTGSIIGMCLIQFKLRLHKLVHPATQSDVGVTEQIGVDRIHHAADLEALALELLIRRHRVAVVGLGQLLGADLNQRLGKRHHLGLLALIAADGPAGAALAGGHANQHQRQPGKTNHPASGAVALSQQEPDEDDRKQENAHAEPESNAADDLNPGLGLNRCRLLSDRRPTVRAG